MSDNKGTSFRSRLTRRYIMRKQAAETTDEAIIENASDDAENLTAQGLEKETADTDGQGIVETKSGEENAVEKSTKQNSPPAAEKAISLEEKELEKLPDYTEGIAYNHDYIKFDRPLKEEKKPKKSKQNGEKILRERRLEGRADDVPFSWYTNKVFLKNAPALKIITKVRTEASLIKTKK